MTTLAAIPPAVVPTPAVAPGPMVDIHGLSFSYRGTTALTDIHLRIEPGTTLGLIGPNGGGKTTLVKLLLGLLEPTAGQIRVAGMSPRDAVRRGDIVGYLPQRAIATPRLPLSVREVVTLGLAGKTGPLRPYAPGDLAFVEHLLTRVGIADLAHRPARELSGGQLQRVFIARALAPRPQLLLLDEPTTGIDHAHQQRFIEQIARLRDELHLTVVFVSHDLRAVTSLCDRIACLQSSLHFHDTPQLLPAEVAYRMFACDLEAMGLGGGHGEHCSHPPHPTPPTS